MSFSGSSDGKKSTCNAGGLGLIPGLGRSPGGRLGNPFHYSYLENLHGQRSLSGYNPWSHKELDTTEQLSTTLPSPLQKKRVPSSKPKVFLLLSSQKGQVTKHMPAAKPSPGCYSWNDFKAIQQSPGTLLRPWGPLARGGQQQP